MTTILSRTRIPVFPRLEWISEEWSRQNFLDGSEQDTIRYRRLLRAGRSMSQIWKVQPIWIVPKGLRRVHALESDVHSHLERGACRR